VCASELILHGHGIGERSTIASDVLVDHQTTQAQIVEDLLIG
jgi:hypothetical protein